MKVLLDISAYSAFNRGDVRLKKWFSAENEIIVPLIVIGELRAGFAVGGRQKENEDLLLRFLNYPNVSTVTLSNATTQCFAEVYTELRRIGKPVGTNDMWIAAMALEYDLSLLTLDADFKNIGTLKLIEL